MGGLSLLQGIFPTQGSNPGLPYCRQTFYQLSHKGNPRIQEWVAYPFSSGSPQPRNLTGVSCLAGGFTSSATRKVTQSNLQIQCNFYQITNGIFHRTRMKNFTICMETQKTPNSQSNLEKEEWSWMNQSSCPQTILLLLLLSRFSRVRLCATPQTAAHQAPLSLGFSRQELEWVAISFSNA